MPPNPSQNTPPARSADRTVVDVVGAVIRDGDRVLLAQRPEGKAQAGLWEFPGGKIEPGETPEEALARECREELAVSIEAPRFSSPVNTALIRCQNRAFDSPVSRSFSEASMPRSAFCVTEKYPVTGA